MKTEVAFFQLQKPIKTKYHVFYKHIFQKEVNCKRLDNLLARNYNDDLTKTGSALVEVLFFFSLNIFLQVKQKTVSWEERPF